MRMKTEYIYIYTYQIEKKYIYVCMYILYMYNNSLPEQHE